MFRIGLASSSGGLRRALHKWGAAAVVAIGLAAVGAVTTTGARTSDAPAAATSVALVNLPAEAQAVHQLILRGGPFPYQKDGTVFGNRERLLPQHPRGHYREYTVKTPGALNRGARRIVCGGNPPTQPEACFYTDDHYATFRRIAP